jgi:hypothetical protein
VYVFYGYEGTVVPALLELPWTAMNMFMALPLAACVFLFIPKAKKVRLHLGGHISIHWVSILLLTLGNHVSATEVNRVSLPSFPSAKFFWQQQLLLDRYHGLL